MTAEESALDPVAPLAEEFAARYRRGERPALSEYTAKYPQLAEQIRQVFPLVALMEEAGPGGAASSADRSPGADRATGPAQGTPQHVGSYRIVREIGRGGMGVVYEAEQVALGRRVALKVLPLHLARLGSGLERFRREARAAARLHHTNIVPVYDVGEEGDVCYYAMQYIHGQPLDQVLQELVQLRDTNNVGPQSPGNAPRSPELASLAERKTVAASLIDRWGEPVAEQPSPPEGELPVASTVVVASGKASTVTHSSRWQYYRSVARVGVQVALALEYAHHEGVLHRDVKPSNLLLDSDGRVWVADFGLAKTDGAALTQAGDVVGTVAYMAPERFRGWSDPRSDVYGLGLTLYEMVALRPAFSGSDRFRLIHQVTHDEPPRLRTLDAQVPRDLATVIAKATDKEPSRRYQSAAELADDLQRFLDDRPILARQTGVLERTWRWCKRNPSVAGLLLALAVTLLGGMSVSTLFAVRASDRADRETIARQDEEIARNWAEAELLRARTAQYALTLNFVQRCLDENDPVYAEELLRTCRADLRGWEYRHLRHQTPVRTFTIHADKVAGVAFHPDGELIASIGWDGLVRLWERATGLERRRLAGHTFPQSHKTPGVVRIHAGLTQGGLAFSRDGKRLVSFSPDQVIVWDVTTAQAVWKRDSHARQRFHAAAFHPDGRRLAVLEGQRLIVWDLHTGREMLTLPVPQSGSCIAFSPDGTRLAAGFGPRLLTWELAMSRPVFDVRTKNTFYQISFRPDGKRLAAGEEVRDAETGRVVVTPRPLEGHHAWGRVQFSPDGRFLVATSAVPSPLRKDAAGRKATVVEVWRRTKPRFIKVLAVWDANTGEAVTAIPAEDWSSSCLAYSPDGRQVATGHDNGQVRLWTGAAPTPGLGAPGAAKTMKALWSPDGERAASSQPDRVSLWDLTTGRALRSWPLPALVGQPAPRLAFSANGRFLAAGRGQDVWVWEAATGRQVGHVGGLQATVRGILPSPDGRRLAVAIDTAVKQADAMPGAGQRVQRVNVVPLNPGPRPAEPPDAKRVEVWDLPAGKCLLTMPHATLYRGTLVFSPDGTRLAVHRAYLGAEHRSEYEIWEVGTGRRLRTGKGPGQGIHSITFGPTGEHLALVCEDRTVRVHDASDGREISALRGHRGAYGPLAYSLDGRRLASFDGRSKVTLWDTATGVELLTLDREDPTLAFRRDWRRLMAFSEQLLPFGVQEAQPANDTRPGEPVR